MGDDAHDASLRMLIRHQWVRDHGTPRVSVLAGPAAAAGRAWRDWLALAGRTYDEAALVLGPAGARADWLDGVAAQALAQASTAPAEPRAIAVDRALVRGWLAARDDRVAAFVREGLIELDGDVASAAVVASVGEGRAGGTRAPAVAPPRARSLAELAMFDALEATPATAGRFQLNQALAIPFGPGAAEVDLLSRDDELVVEIDGYHHFTDADAYRRDRKKDLLLQAHGYVVLRFLADDVLADPRVAVRAVVELLGVRRGRAQRHRDR